MRFFALPSPHLARRIAALGAALGLGTLLPNAAAAQDPNTTPAPGTPIQIPPITVESQQGETAYGPVQGYRATRTAVGTRTDTPIERIPQSIQVIPRQIMDDQGARRLTDALRNVSAVTSNTATYRFFNDFVVRGFAGGNFFRDGLRDDTFSLSYSLVGIERVEVLKGPASIMYGSGNPGGTINFVSRMPLPTRQIRAELFGGSYGLIGGIFDATGAVNSDGTMLYRFIASRDDGGGFVDFTGGRRSFVNAAFSYTPRPGRTFSFQSEYRNARELNFFGVPAFGSISGLNRVHYPRSRNFQEPTDFREYDVFSNTAVLDYQIDDVWSARTSMRLNLHTYSYDQSVQTSINTNTLRLNRQFTRGYQNPHSFNLDTHATAKFAVSRTRHELTFGGQANYSTQGVDVRRGTIASISLTNPVYGATPGPLAQQIDTRNNQLNWGAYVQDQIAVTEQIDILAGTRFDWLDTSVDNHLTGRTQQERNTAVSSRIGIVYKPFTWGSVFAGYAQSFLPVSPEFTTVDGSTFSPERAYQYEVGVRLTPLPRLSASAAVFEINRTDVVVQDPVNAGFAIQTGKQRSRGFEVDVIGEILPGLNVVANYAYLDAVIVSDSRFASGNRLNNVPRNSARLWLTYERPLGNDISAGIGGGVYFVGRRAGDLANTFELPAYTIYDAMAFVRRRNVTLSLNAYNLLDEDYIESATSNVRVYRGEPLTLVARLSSTF